MRIALLALLMVGCAPTTVQTARTNGEGNFQLGIEPGVIGAAGAGEVGVVPAINVSARYGISDRVDIGGRIGSSIYELQFKYMFTDPAATDSIALALAPSTSILGGGGGGVGGLWWDTKIPLLVGIPISAHELTLGARLRPWLFVGGGDGSSGGGLVLFTGASAGFAIKAADKFRIMPELGVDVPVVGAAAIDGDSGVGIGTDAALLMFTVGFLLGGPD